MTAIKSLEDLKKRRTEAFEKRNAKMTSGTVQIIVGMGTCSIAAGACETRQAILDQIKAENLSSILVTQAGCLGLCSSEPIVQVVVDDNPKVTYGKVSPSVAGRILKEHVEGGHVVMEHVIKV